MFSGIVEEMAKVFSVDQRSSGCRLSITSHLDHRSTEIGDSLAVEGVCLTIVEKNGSNLAFDVSPETLRRSTLEGLTVGSAVNLERSLKVGDRVHGHFVYGHVDTTVALISRTAEKESIKMVWSLPENEQERNSIAPKGSVALAGVSLTVGEVEDGCFSVYLIPHTLEVTTLSEVKAGQRVNLEVDVLARYVESMLFRSGGHGTRSSRVTLEFLREHGFAGDDD